MNKYVSNTFQFGTPFHMDSLSYLQVGSGVNNEYAARVCQDESYPHKQSSYSSTSSSSVNLSISRAQQSLLFQNISDSSFENSRNSAFHVVPENIQEEYPHWSPNANRGWRRSTNDDAGDFSGHVSIYRDQIGPEGRAYHAENRHWLSYDKRNDKTSPVRSQVAHNINQASFFQRQQPPRNVAHCYPAPAADRVWAWTSAPSYSEAQIALPSSPAWPGGLEPTQSTYAASQQPWSAGPSPSTDEGELEEFSVGGGHPY